MKRKVQQPNLNHNLTAAKDPELTPQKTLRISIAAIQARSAALGMKNLNEKLLSLQSMEDFNINTLQNTYDFVLQRLDNLRDSVKYVQPLLQDEGKQHELSRIHSALHIQIEGIKHQKTLLKEAVELGHQENAYLILFDPEASQMFELKNHPQHGKTVVGGNPIKLPTPFDTLEVTTRHNEHHVIRNLGKHFANIFHHLDKKLCKLSPKLENAQTPKYETMRDLTGAKITTQKGPSQAVDGNFLRGKLAKSNSDRPMVQLAEHTIYNREYDNRSTLEKQIDLDLAYASVTRKR